MIAVNKGCFSDHRHLEFRYVEEFGGSLFLSPAGVGDPREKKVDVECVTLDAFLAEPEVPQVDVINIDVEGAEEDALRNAERTCLEHHPVLLIEFNPATAKLFFARELAPLYERLIDWKYGVFLIERPSGSLWKVPQYGDLMDRLALQDGVATSFARPMTFQPREHSR